MEICNKMIFSHKKTCSAFFAASCARIRPGYFPYGFVGQFYFFRDAFCYLSIVAENRKAKKKETEQNTNNKKGNEWKCKKSKKKLVFLTDNMIEPPYLKTEKLFSNELAG